MLVIQLETKSRAALISRGRRFEYSTAAFNSTKAFVAPVVAGFRAFADRALLPLTKKLFASTIRREAKIYAAE
jgi:hypothetical protein